MSDKEQPTGDTAGQRLAEVSLLACPFCGGRAEIKLGARLGYIARCALFDNSCHTHPSTIECKTPEAAAKKWNRRHANTEVSNPDDENQKPQKGQNV